MKHVCPHCGEKAISPLKKAFAGNPQSKGTVCPNCGKRSTNDLHSAVFHGIADLIALIFVVYTYITDETVTGLYYMIGAIVLAFIVTHVTDAFFFKLAPATRLDLK